MAKIVDKTDVEYKDGFFVYEGEIVNVMPSEVTEQFNDVEGVIQYARYLKSIGKIDPIEEPEPFRRIGVQVVRVGQIEADTPAMDAKAKEIVKLIEEANEVSEADAFNKFMDGKRDMYKWIDSPWVVVTKNESGSESWDNPMLGNPLLIEFDDISKLFIGFTGFIEDAIEFMDGKVR